MLVRAEPEARERADSLTIALVAALRARGEAAIVPDPPPIVPRISAELVAAERAYELLRPDEARSQLADALARVAIGELTTTRGELVRALLLLAMCAAAEGAEDAAIEAIDRALAVDPELEPDPARYPPTLRERIAARRDARAALSRAILSVRTEPPSAAITVDGAPTEHHVEVAPGTHVVAASAPGRRTVTRAIAIDGDLTLELALAGDPIAALAHPGAPGAPLDPAQIEAARALGARPLVVELRFDGSRAHLLAIDGPHRAVVELEADASMERAADALVTAILTPMAAADPTPWIVAGTTLGATAAIAIAIAIGVVVGSQSTDTWDARGTVVR